MSSWLTDYQEDNTVEKELISLLEHIRKRFPEEKETIDTLKSILQRNEINDEILFIIRDKLRRIISRSEYNLIKKRDEIWKIISRISSLKTEKNDDGLYDFEDCFPPDYDFFIGENYYYLRFPKLHVKTDGNVKTELMLDRHIKTFIKNALQNYKMEREEYEKFEEFTLVFLHHLTAENASVIDTDNIEIKKPIDAVNGLLITNDNAIYSDIFQIVVPSNEEYTEMYILKGHGLGGSILKLLEELNR